MRVNKLVSRLPVEKGKRRRPLPDDVVHVDFGDRDLGAFQSAGVTSRAVVDDPNQTIAQVSYLNEEGQPTGTWDWENHEDLKDDSGQSYGRQKSGDDSPAGSHNEQRHPQRRTRRQMPGLQPIQTDDDDGISLEPFEDDGVETEDLYQWQEEQLTNLDPEEQNPGEQGTTKSGDDSPRGKGSEQRHPQRRTRRTLPRANDAQGHELYDEIRAQGEDLSWAPNSTIYGEEQHPGQQGTQKADDEPVVPWRPATQHEREQHEYDRRTNSADYKNWNDYAEPDEPFDPAWWAGIPEDEENSLEDGHNYGTPRRTMSPKGPAQPNTGDPNHPRHGPRIKRLDAILQKSAILKHKLTPKFTEAKPWPPVDKLESKIGIPKSADEEEYDDGPDEPELEVGDRVVVEDKDRRNKQEGWRFNGTLLETDHDAPRIDAEDPVMANRHLGTTTPRFSKPNIRKRPPAYEVEQKSILSDFYAFREVRKNQHAAPAGGPKQPKPGENPKPKAPQQQAPEPLPQAQQPLPTRTNKPKDRQPVNNAGVSGWGGEEEPKRALGPKRRKPQYEPSEELGFRGDEDAPQGKPNLSGMKVPRKFDNAEYGERAEAYGPTTRGREQPGKEGQRQPASKPRPALKKVRGIRDNSGGGLGARLHAAGLDAVAGNSIARSVDWTQPLNDAVAQFYDALDKAKVDLSDPKAVQDVVAASKYMADKMARRQGKPKSRELPKTGPAAQAAKTPAGQAFGQWVNSKKVNQESLNALHDRAIERLRDGSMTPEDIADRVRIKDKLNLKGKPLSDQDKAVLINYLADLKYEVDDADQIEYGKKQRQQELDAFARKRAAEDEQYERDLMGRDTGADPSSLEGDDLAAQLQAANPELFRGRKSLRREVRKSGSLAGKPCEPGQTAARTGCEPSGDDGSSRDTKLESHGKKDTEWVRPSMKKRRGFLGAVDAVADTVDSAKKIAYHSLPQSLQKLVDTVQHYEHKLETLYKETQQLAKEVALETGSSEENVERVGRILSWVDLPQRWSTNIYGLHHILDHVAHLGGPVSFVAAKLGYWVPVSSILWLTYSAAKVSSQGRDPVQVIAAARKRAKAAVEAMEKEKKHKKLFASVVKGVILKAEEDEYESEPQKLDSQQTPRPPETHMSTDTRVRPAAQGSSQTPRTPATDEGIFEAPTTPARNLPSTRNFAQAQTEAQGQRYAQEQRQPTDVEGPPVEEPEPTPEPEYKPAPGPWQREQVDPSKHITPEIHEVLYDAAVGADDVSVAATADWLRDIGYEITPEMESDPERVEVLARQLLYPEILNEWVRRGEWGHASDSHVEDIALGYYEDTGEPVVHSVYIRQGEMTTERGGKVPVYRYEALDGDSGWLQENGGWVFDPQEAEADARTYIEENREAHQFGNQFDDDDDFDPDEEEEFDDDE